MDICSFDPGRRRIAEGAFRGGGPGGGGGPPWEKCPGEKKMPAPPLSKSCASHAEGPLFCCDLFEYVRSNPYSRQYKCANAESSNLLGTLTC